MGVLALSKVPVTTTGLWTERGNQVCNAASDNDLQGVLGCGAAHVVWSTCEIDEARSQLQVTSLTRRFTQRPRLYQRQDGLKSIKTLLSPVHQTNSESWFNPSSSKSCSNPSYSKGSSKSCSDPSYSRSCSDPSYSKSCSDPGSSKSCSDPSSYKSCSDPGSSKSCYGSGSSDSGSESSNSGPQVSSACYRKGKRRKDNDSTTGLWYNGEPHDLPGRGGGESSKLFSRVWSHRRSVQTWTVDEC